MLYRNISVELWLVIYISYMVIALNKQKSWKYHHEKSHNKSRKHSLKKMQAAVSLEDPIYHMLWTFIISNISKQLEMHWFL